MNKPIHTNNNNVATDSSRRDFLKKGILASGIVGGGMLTSGILSPLNAADSKQVRDLPLPKESPKPSVEQNLAEFQNAQPITSKGYAAFDKAKEAKALGIKRFVHVKSKAFTQIANEFDFIISTIPYHYNVNDYHKMLKFGAEMAIVGLPAPEDKPKLDFDAFVWQFQNKKIYPSAIGGIKETQEMLDYSVKNNIYPDVEIIPIQKLDEAYQVVAAGKAKFRYVIDMNSLS